MALVAHHRGKWLLATEIWAANGMLLCSLVAHSHSARMFVNAYVHGSAREQAAREHRNELSNLTHRSQPSAHGLSTG